MDDGICDAIAEYEPLSRQCMVSKHPWTSFDRGAINGWPDRNVETSRIGYYDGTEFIVTALFSSLLCETMNAFSRRRHASEHHPKN